MSKLQLLIKRPGRTGLLMTPSYQFVSRRTFVVGSILTGCAASGLFTGMVTALATRRRVLPLAMPQLVTPPPNMLGALQPTVFFSGHQQTVRTVAWSPDGTTIASGADDAMLLLWTPDGQVQQQIPHPEEVTAVAWSPPGQRWQVDRAMLCVSSMVVALRRFLPRAIPIEHRSRASPGRLRQGIL